MSKQRINTNRQTMRGFTLIEVLVTLVVLAIGLLGLAGLQANSLKHNNNAYQRTQATYFAYDILDRMRTNPEGVEAGDYDAINTTPPPTAPTCLVSAGTICNPADLVLNDTFEWATRLAATLPSGRGTVTATVPGTPNAPFTVTVMWDDMRTGATGTNCNAADPDDMICFSVTGQVLFDRF